MITTIILWILKSLVIIGIFQFFVPTLINAITENKCIKLPVMIIFALFAGIFMAWLNYIPYLLFFLWLALNKYTLQAMTEEKFESDSGIKINKPLFYISSYSYVILSCISAWFFQTEIVTTGEPTGNGILLWKHLLGFILPNVGTKVGFFSWVSIIFYCFFSTFVYYQQLHVRSFRGRSKNFLIVLSISAFTGMITGLGYLIYYGWTVVWWAPFVIFIISILFEFLIFPIEQLVGVFAISLLGFFGWPICAFFMFRYIPKVI